MAEDGRIEITRRSLRPIDGDVAVTLPNGETETLTLVDQGDGRANAVLESENPGLYRFEHDDQSAIAIAGTGLGRELEDVRATDAVLTPAVDATGGSLTWLAKDGLPTTRRVREGRDAAGRGWIGLVEQRQFLVTGLDQVPLMPAWLLLAFALGGLMLGWRAEGR